MNLFCRSVAAFLFLSIITARAEEGGAGHYAPGSFASFLDQLPAQPGFGVANYFAYYNGDAGAGRALPIGGELALNVSAAAYTDALCGFWVTPLKIFGGNYAAGVAIPLVSNSVTAQVTLPRLGTVSRTGTAGGLGDIEFFPVAIGWSAMGGDLHVNFFDGIYAPSGIYEKNQLANQGLGYWTFEPGVLISYLGQKNGFEATTYLGYDINTNNNTTDYHSGQVFHIDTTVAQHLPLGKAIVGIGVNGFYLQQTTGDSGSGARLGSFEQRTAGVGPVVSYVEQFGKTTLAAEVKWLPQIDAQKTLQGNYLWCKVGLQF
jgi:hypothetical protein